jgi:hypothetical protein
MDPGACNQALLGTGLLALGVGGMLLYFDDHERDKYKPHSLLLYVLNVFVNIIPGMVFFPILLTLMIFPRAERYIPAYYPWIDIGLEEKKFRLNDDVQQPHPHHLNVHVLATDTE